MINIAVYIVKANTCSHVKYRINIMEISLRVYNKAQKQNKYNYLFPII